MKIYVITHKVYSNIKSSYPYQPLLVGTSLGNSGLDSYLKDNEGENISKKNKNYCELTGMYWIWKNQLTSHNIVGITHYRRYFVKNRKFFRKSSLLTENDIKEALSYSDIILPEKSERQYNGQTAEKFFSINHDWKVWNFTQKIIKEKYPDYLEDFKWFSTQTSGFCFNMMICDSNLYNLYCCWLFPILFELESLIDFSNYDDYNKRMIGFVSERLINIWVHHNNLRVKTYPIYFEKKHNIKNKFSKLLFKG